jgi:Ca-activated chloride channel family protein
MLPDDTTHGDTTTVRVEVTGRSSEAEDALAVTVDGQELLLVGTDPMEPGLYDVGNVRAVDAAVVTAVEDWLDGAPSCPDCEGPLAYDPPVPLSGVDPTVADGVLAATDATTVDAVEHGSTGVDDWTGQPNTRSPPGRHPDVWRSDLDVDLHCEDCGRSFDLAEHDREAFHDDDGRMEELVDHALENADAGATAAPSAGGQAMASQERMTAAEPADLGMATGGAKDATNFRDNVAEGYVPQPDGVSHEGLFYDYYFDTGDGDGERDDDALFYPSYSAAVTDDPLTGDVERYLTVGLNSTLTEADFQRKRLNLVAVLDVSGSMSSAFSEYYYDRHGREREADVGEETKMEAAREALAALTTHLDADDRFGVVLYNSRAHVANPLRDVGSTDMDAIRGHIREVQAGGGTDLSAGFRAGVDVLADVDGDPTEVENRIVFLTDMMPNLGELEEGGLVSLVEDAADDGVYTTFVGMGIDANPDLADALSAVRGANHYFVHSADEFEQRLDDEFAYMVTPLVFDLSLDVVGDGYEIAGVYGSPDADAATGEVMHVPTLFPSPTEEGETRGGVVLLELAETGHDPGLELVASWVERDGSEHRDAVAVEFPAAGPEQFDNSGVRKAVLLTRYAELLRDWSRAVRDGAGGEESDEADDREGEVDDWQHGGERELSDWEQESVPLQVPGEYADLFEQFREHLHEEMDAIGDEDLEQEVEVLAGLLDAAE